MKKVGIVARALSIGNGGGGGFARTPPVIGIDNCRRVVSQNEAAPLGLTIHS